MSRDARSDLMTLCHARADARNEAESAVCDLFEDLLTKRAAGQKNFIEASMPSEDEK